MPVALSAVALATVVGRLRAAGCVFAEDEAELLLASASTPAGLEALVDRRVEGLPLEQVVGWADFCGVRVLLTPGVFVPRARTALLVREAVARCRPDTLVVDLCCGSGAIGAAILAAVPVRLWASDIEAGSVACARVNLEPLGAGVVEGDLFASVPAELRGQVEVLVANIPYVPTEDVAYLPAEARLYEPLVTLDGGADGLDVLRRVVAEAAEWLAPGGHLLVETSERQLPAAAAILERAGLAVRVAEDDELEATVVIGTLVLGTTSPQASRRCTTDE